MMTRKKIEGYILLALAALCFWLPGYMQMPGTANGKILVSTSALDGGPFEKSVLLVTKHNGYGAQGFILNKPADNSDDPANGGPLEQERIYTLHSLDIESDATEKMPKLDAGLTEGKDFVYNLKKRERKPDRYIIMKGYAGWGRKQLDAEVAEGTWKLVEYDRSLVFDTPPKKMYEAASRK